MSATVVTRPPAEPLARTGTAELDDAAMRVVRAYVEAADASTEAKRQLDEARAALDAVAGASQTLSYGSTLVVLFSPTTKRSVDLDRLASRWPEAYADVTTETSGHRLTIRDAVRQVLRRRDWRAALARRVGA